MNISPVTSNFSLDEDFGSIPILKRKGVEIPKRTTRYKSSNNYHSKPSLANKSSSRTSSKLPEMPESLVSRLGKLNYYSRLNKKDMEFKAKMLSNRIEKLKAEEKRVHQNIKQTSK